MSWWGLWIIAALDSSMLFFLPMAVDIAVVILASRSHQLFWLYPILGAAGSLCGAAITYYIGRRLGEAGLEHFVSAKSLGRVQRRIKGRGAAAFGVLSLLPPPFPFTACSLVAGALELNAAIFFTTLFLTRLMRFGGEAVLAYFYGPQIIVWLKSSTVEYIGVALFAAAVIGSAITSIQVVRRARSHRRRSRLGRVA
ncbi:MAG TPA: VTT domain-containing protein [Anaerolineales bacterium]